LNLQPRIPATVLSLLALAAVPAAAVTV